MRICRVFAILCALTILQSIAGQTCPQGWDSFDSFCYLVKSTVLTWQEAQNYCREVGGDLVKITSERENEFVLALARKKAPSVEQVWIGLMLIEGAHYWSDYSVPVYTKWARDEPNGGDQEPCSNMWTGHTSHLPWWASGDWNDLTCNVDQTYPCGFVCEALP